MDTSFDFDLPFTVTVVKQWQDRNSGQGDETEKVASEPKETKKIDQPSFCQFCKKNEECRCLRQPGYRPNDQLWLLHRLKDENGRCCCPKLRAHVCEYCGQTGDQAHTIRYCKQRKRDYQLLK